MENVWTGALSALWLGILTSISPCPLATNIVAISYVVNRVGHPRQVIWAGILYTLGRMTAYALVGMLLVASVLSVPDVAQFLQRYMNRLLGPILVLSGLLLLELVKLRLPGSGGLKARFQQWAEKGGPWSAAALGFLFALSFCPLSAALFFGSLIPLAIRSGSRVLMPSLYGIGTAVPVLGVVLLVALGTQVTGRVFEHLTRFETWARRITAFAFIAVGVYYALIYNAGLAL